MNAPLRLFLSYGYDAITISDFRHLSREGDSEVQCP